MFANIIIGIFVFLFLCIKAVRKLLRLVIWMPIWYVVYFFLCRPKLTIFIVAFALGMGAYKGTSILDWLARVTTPSASQPQQQTPQGAVLTAQKVTQLPAIAGDIHDGNSKFAEDMLPRFNEPELLAYSKMFYEAILYGKDNEPLMWKISDKTFGKITPAKGFVSNGGAQCRPYREVLSIAGYAQEAREVACEQDDKKGWCRLSPDAIPSCEIGYGSSWDHTMSKITNYFTSW